MGKFKWVGTILTVAGLVVLAVQNTTPRLALVILGARTPVLPLAVWLLGAIALGALTAVVLITVTAPLSGAAPPSNRRRWQVKPEPSGPSRRPASSQGAASRRRPPPNRPATNFTADSFPDRDRPNSQPYEDWEDWGQRSPASQWQDWDRAAQGQSQRSSRPIPKRQQRAQAQAEEVFEDIATGWDERAAATPPPRPTGVSPVEEALEDIAEGWEDWDDPEEIRRDNAPEPRSIYEVQRSPESVSKSGTHYSYRYRTADDLRRRPSDPEAEPAEAATTVDEADPVTPLDVPEVGPDGVYDADYRVIIPPSRPLEDDSEQDGDRP
jgi:hypothetical protein